MCRDIEYMWKGRSTCVCVAQGRLPELWVLMNLSKKDRHLHVPKWWTSVQGEEEEEEEEELRSSSSSSMELEENFLKTNFESLSSEQADAFFSCGHTDPQTTPRLSLSARYLSQSQKSVSPPSPVCVCVCVCGD